MITKIISVDTLKQIFVEILLNKTNKISDISNESVLNGIAYGCAKLAQRLLVNQGVVEGHLFPDTAYGDYLDEIAKSRGIAPRFTSYGSTTYVRLQADQGTFYPAGTTFTSSNGIQFISTEDYTIGVDGYGFVKVNSIQTGSATNVDALTINTISIAPAGHIACTNDYAATGGRDDESDDDFRIRIKASVNQLARNTMSYLEQVFMKVNQRVLRVHRGGVDEDGRIILIVVPINGADFNDDEFNAIMSQSEEFLSLNELTRETVKGFPIKLVNPDWYPIDIDFRCDIDPAYDQATVRRNMQLAVSRLFDYRYWGVNEKVEWENILYAIRNVDGVRYVSDAYFLPNSDINITNYKLPRVRGFIVRDLDGGVLSDNYNMTNNFVWTDYFFPNTNDDNFQQSVIKNIS